VKSRKQTTGTIMRRHLARTLGALAAVLCASNAAVAQVNIQYTDGQNIQPVYEGWLRNSDGTFDMYFGYLNRNYVEAPHIPVGPNNSFEPGPPDRGQPTHFYHRRNQFVFSVKVPADWGTKDLVWTVTHNGKTDKAIGTLALVWEVDPAMMVKNINGQDDLVNVSSDKPPVLVINAVSQASVSQPVTLTATVTDDGIPPPAKPTVGRAGGRGRGGGAAVNAPRFPPPPKFLNQGLSVGWLHYRGPGKVTFQPDGFVSVQNGQPSVTTVTFSEPGTYVLRAVAADSWLFVQRDVTVTVSGGSTVQR
jgi:hypothetical protein